MTYRADFVVDARPAAVRLHNRARVARRQHGGSQQLFAVLGPDELDLVLRQGQRCHLALVDEQATSVGAAIREDLQVRGVGQGASGELLALGVLLTARQPFGERVYLWCRAGTSADDLASARGLLAAACRADDIRVARSPRYAHLVTVDVIRHRQLGAQTGPGQAGPVSAAGILLVIPPPGGPADDGASQASDPELPRWPKSA